METTNLKKANEMFNDANATMMSIYKKQLNTSMDFYTNLFNSFSGLNKNGWSPNFNSPLLNSGEALKSMFAPFNFFKPDGNFSNTFSTPFDNLYKQMIEFNNNWFISLQKEFQGKQESWIEASEKYRELIEEEWKATQNIVNTIIETYNKEMDFSVETNKKLVQEIDKQFHLVSKQNARILADILKSVNISDKTEKENGTESKQSQSKKHSKVELAL